MEAWDNIFAPTPELARLLIGDQFPAINSSEITFLGEGWDCVAFRCEDWVFRFPRRPLGVETLENERAVLPELGRSILTGEPSPDFPYLFLGSEYQNGRPLEEHKGKRHHLASELGCWLSQLHRSQKPRSIRSDSLGKLEPDKRGRQIYLLLGHTPNWLPKSPLNSSYRVVAHGDLYCRHIYVNAVGSLQGVIDWGDVHWGHPAVDLACAFALFDSEERDEFWRAYGEATSETLLWARFRALYHSLLVRDYATKSQLTFLAREAEQAVSRCLRESAGKGT